MDIGFEPVVCSGWPYSLIFLAKAVAPYVLILMVGAGLPAYIKFRKHRRLKAGKEIHEDDNVPLKQRMIGALVFVMYYLFPSTIIGLFKTFYCTVRRDSAEHSSRLDVLLSQLWTGFSFPRIALPFLDRNPSEKLFTTTPCIGIS